MTGYIRYMRMRWADANEAARGGDAMSESVSDQREEALSKTEASVYTLLLERLDSE